MLDNSEPLNWSSEDVKNWLFEHRYSVNTINFLIDTHELDGKSLLALNDQDFLIEPLIKLTLRERKSLLLDVRKLQRNHRPSLIDAGIIADLSSYRNSQLLPYNSLSKEGFYGENIYAHWSNHKYNDSELSDELPICFPDEIGKAVISFIYMVSVTWITAFVMVIVHDRVPDMQKYPPLPDIVLDNIPYIPWAFHMCEITGTLLFIVWFLVLIFHKHRFILMRRFFALSGTIFFLRCITMLITSLSVPGVHLECKPRTFNTANIYVEVVKKISQAYVIWRGAGMSIRGVRTCGDYMFSGHTVALTILNFFITEYTPSDWYFLHTITWLLNMFGIFFILAGHEHYSIDVFIAFYITSRLFLYYHTLSNNRALMQRDAYRRRIWFPLFSYFESSVDGIVPNEFNSLCDIIFKIYQLLVTACIKFNSVFYTKYTKLLDDKIKKK